MVAFGAEGQPFQQLQNEINAINTQLQNIKLTPGPQGIVGPAGAVGAVGPAGAQGPAGAAGATGATGSAGPKGDIGATGAAGLTGATGANGPIGPVGPAGATGAIGSIGPKGDTGATGLTGAAGPAGATGAVGPIGPVGPAGATGAIGPAGAAGAQGQQGAPGQSIQGIQGPPGPPGPAGPAGTASIAALNGTPCTALDGSLSVLQVTLSGDGLYTLKCPRIPSTAGIVFISSQSYNGNLGGLLGADLICQSLATSVHLTGVFKAWLSDGIDSPTTRFIQNPHGYKQVNNVSIADSWDTLVTGTLANALVIDEHGSTVPRDQHAWTDVANMGTPASSTTIPISSPNCQGWTVAYAGGGIWGQAGGVGARDSAWTYESAAYPCNEPCRLYCFQQ